MGITNESPRSKATRANILLYLSAFVALLGVPLFFYTTLIHRAHLPADEVEQRAGEFGQNVRFQIPIYFDSSLASKPLIELTQHEVDASLNHHSLSQTWGLVLKDNGAKPIDASKDYVVRLEQKASTDMSQQPFMCRLSPVSKEIFIFASPEALSTESLASYISAALLEIVFKDELTAVSKISNNDHNTDVVFPYSPTYNVVFNLFVEDGRPVNWKIEKAAEFIEPVFGALANFCKFRISSQIQYYSKLQNEPVLNANASARIIPKTDLATFINYGEWNLNTHDIAPSINFLVFFPKSNYQSIPLLVENSTTNSFLIPQWGGVHIFNSKTEIPNGETFQFSASQLESIFDIFASQLFELLGVPREPQSPFLRVAAFNRLASLKNLKRSLSNLSALLKISSSLNGISIPESTREHVLASLEFYDKAVESLHKNDFAASVAFSAKSVDNSDKAFFEKEMVQQAYFPSEHKLAVFLPLLGPICSIVFFGLLKYIKDRRLDSTKSIKKDV